MTTSSTSPIDAAVAAAPAVRWTPVARESRGHMGWQFTDHTDFEIFEADGEVMRAPAHNAIDIDTGQRHARSQGWMATWKRFGAEVMIGKGFRPARVAA